MCVAFMDSSGVNLLVHMVPANRTVKEAFSWKTISRDTLFNLNTVWFKVYEKWVKRHQSALTVQVNTLKRSEKK